MSVDYEREALRLLDRSQYAPRDTDALLLATQAQAFATLHAAKQTRRVLDLVARSGGTIDLHDITEDTGNADRNA